MSARNGSLTALEQADAFVARHIGPREDDVAAMLEAVGYDSLDALMDAAVPASIRAADSGGFPRKPHRTRRAGGAGGARRAQPGRALHDRPRLSRHAHAACHPAQHPGESGLVHRLHALSAGDFAREAGGAAQLPDHGDGPHRPFLHQCLAAGRGHGGGRGHAHEPRHRPERQRPLLRLRRLPAADHRGGADPRRGHRYRGGGGRSPRRAAGGAVLRRPAAVSGGRRGGNRLSRDRRAGACTGRHRHGRGRPVEPGPADAAGRVRRRHRGRQLAALRRPPRLWRPARGILRHPREVPARHAGPHRRRLGRQPRAAGAEARAPDPRAAHQAREGDQQHLHGPGAARRDRRHVRGLSRARGAEADRPARPPSRRHPGGGARTPRLRHRERELVRHAHGPRAGQCRGDS